MKVVSRSEEQTRTLAARLGRGALGGDLLCLIGPLGSGKTTFVQGFVRSIGFRGAVASPSFSLVREYRAPRRPVYHMDLFRVRAPELAPLGLREYIDDPRGICLIEWPEVARAVLPRDRVEIRFAHVDGGRVLRGRALGPRSARLLLRFGRPDGSSGSF